MPSQYPSFNDREFDLLKKLVNNTGLIVDGGGGGGGVTSIIAGTGISVNQSTGAVTITNTGSGAVSSVFARSGDVVALAADYASFYGQLATSNSWTGVNTYSGSFIFTPATITIAANAGAIDISKVHSTATNNANTALTPSGTGILGQQICIIFVNSGGAAVTVTGAGSASSISYTAAASTTTTTYWRSNGSVWSVVGGAPTINDLTTITVASNDLTDLWDVSAGVSGKATVASLVSAALTAAPATVPQGGTGLATLTSGAILTGNGTGNVTSITPGTGVAAALAVNVGSAGAPVLFNGALGTPSSGNVGACTVDGTNTVGFLIVPSNSQSAAYTAVLADSGKAIDHPASDANARTFTIPSNASVAYPIGACISFSNMTTQAVTIAINTDTMYLAGTGTTGSRTLAQYGVATARKITSTNWLISGVGLT